MGFAKILGFFTKGPLEPYKKGFTRIFTSEIFLTISLYSTSIKTPTVISKQTYCTLIYPFLREH